MSWECYYDDKGTWVPFSEDGNKQANVHLHARPGHHEFSIDHHWKSPWSGKWKTTVYAIDVRGKHQTNTEAGGRQTQRKIKLVWSDDPSKELDLATWGPGGPSSAAAAPPASTAASTAAAADTAASTAAVVSETKPAPGSWANANLDPWARATFQGDLGNLDDWGQSSKHAGWNDSSKHAGWNDTQSGWNHSSKHAGWNDHQHRGSYNTDGRRRVPPPASSNGDQPATEASQAGTQEAPFPKDWDDVKDDGKNVPPKMDGSPEGMRISQVTATKAPMPAPPTSLPAYSTPAQANANKRPQAVWPTGINGCATDSLNSPTKQIAKVEKITNDGTAQGSDEATPNVSLTNDASISIEEHALGGDAPSPPTQPDVETGSISMSDAVQAEQIAALQLQLQSLRAENEAMKAAAIEPLPWSPEGHAQ